MIFRWTEWVLVVLMVAGAAGVLGWSFYALDRGVESLSLDFAFTLYVTILFVLVKDARPQESSVPSVPKAKLQ